MCLPAPVAPHSCARLCKQFSRLARSRGRRIDNNCDNFTIHSTTRVLLHCAQALSVCVFALCPPSSPLHSAVDLAGRRSHPLLRDNQRPDEGTVHTPADVHHPLCRLPAALPGGGAPRQLRLPLCKVSGFLS